DRRGEAAQRLRETIARRVFGESIELAAIAVRAAAVGANADGNRELLIETDELLVEVVRLIAELRDLVQRRNVGATLRDHTCRCQAALPHEIVAYVLRLVCSANRRLRRVEPLVSRVERPNGVEALVDVAAARVVDLRRAQEAVRRLELQVVRRV